MGDTPPSLRGERTLSIGSCSLSEKAVEERHLEGDHLVASCQLTRDSSRVIPSHALLDDSATGYAFMYENFARRHNFPLIPLKKPRDLEVIDGRPVVSGAITHLAHAKLQIRNHVEEAFFFITKLGHYPIVLGIPWRRHHDVSIRYSQNKVTFDSKLCCQQHNAHGRPTWIKGLDFIPENPPPNRMAFVGCSALLRHVKKGLQVFTVTMREIDAATKLGRTRRNW